MEAETTGIMISSGAVGAICGVVGTWLKSKVGTKIKRPLDSDDTYVTHKECKEHRCALEKRIDQLAPALERIDHKIDANEAKAEQRAVDLHRRLDPVVQKVASNSAKVETVEELVKAAFARPVIGAPRK